MLIQQVAGAYIISPAVDRLSPELPFLSYPKPKLEEQAVEKLRVYKQELEFDALLNSDQPLEADQLRQKLAEIPSYDVYTKAIDTYTLTTYTC